MRKFITVINVMLMLTGKTVYAEDIDIVVEGQSQDLTVSISQTKLRWEVVCRIAQ
jgi:hypothetical protein